MTLRYSLHYSSFVKYLHFCKICNPFEILVVWKPYVKKSISVFELLTANFSFVLYGGTKREHLADCEVKMTQRVI